jgi:hypothetical protein
MKRNFLFFACAFVLCAIFVIYLSHFSTGIPKSDDFPMMLRFLDHWGQSITFSEKYKLLTEQFLEHRMIAMKLTVLSVKSIYGTLNINVVNSIGIVVWLATLFVLFKAFTHTQLPLVSFIPVLLVTLHPGYGFDGLLWAATWMAFPWAIFLSLTSFYLLAFKRSRVSSTLAWLLLVLALFSHGNGIFSIFMGAGILLTQKRWKELGAFGAASLLALTVFFIGYTQAGTMESSPLENMLHRPAYIIGSIGAFTGASIYFPDLERTPIVPSQLPAIGFGLLLCLAVTGFSIYLLRRIWTDTAPTENKSPKNDFLIFCCAIGIFVIVTGTVMSCIRTLNETIGAFSARYHFYSALFISAVYMIVIVEIPVLAKKSVFRALFLMLGIVYCMGQYWYQTAEIAHNVRIFQAGLYNFKNSGRWIIYKEARIWERGVNDYSKKNLSGSQSPNFKLPDHFVSHHKANPRIRELSELSSQNSLAITDTEDSLEVHVKGPEFQITMWDQPANATYIYLSSSTNHMLYPLFQQREGLRQFLRSRLYYKGEARVALRKKWFPPGEYQVYLFIVRDNSSVLINPRRVVRIKKYPFEV